MVPFRCTGQMWRSVPVSWWLVIWGRSGGWPCHPKAGCGPPARVLAWLHGRLLQAAAAHQPAGQHRACCCGRHGRQTADGCWSALAHTSGQEGQPACMSITTLAQMQVTTAAASAGQRGEQRPQRTQPGATEHRRSPAADRPQQRRRCGCGGRRNDSSKPAAACAWHGSSSHTPKPNRANGVPQVCAVTCSGALSWSQAPDQGPHTGARLQNNAGAICRVGQPPDGGAQLAKAHPPQQLQTPDSTGAAGSSSFIAAASPAMRTRQVRRARSVCML
jgi:hypothetical protein